MTISTQSQTYLTFNDKPVWLSRLSNKGIKRIWSIDPKYPCLVKLWQPRMNARLDKTSWLIFADFDALPPGFECWDGLAEYLKTFQYGCVLRTMSGKTKLALLVESDGMSINIALDTIRKVIGDLTDHCDKQGLMSSFIHPSQFPILAAYLESAPLMPAVRDSRDWSFTSMPETPELKRTARKLLNAIYSAWFETVEISQSYFADLLGVSQKSISKNLKKLVDLGYIAVASKSYKVGVRSKRYKMLWRAGLRIKAVAKEVRGYISKIENGDWNRSLWSLTWGFPNGVDYIQHVKSIPGSSIKGRLKKAVGCWNYYAKRFKLEGITIMEAFRIS